MSNLYDLAREAIEIETMLIQSGGELTPEIEARLSVNSDGLASKIDAYVNVIERLNLAEKYFAEKSIQYGNVASAIERAQERIKSNMKAALTAMGAQSIVGNDYKISISPTKGRLVINEDQLSVKYVKEKIELVADKEKIRAALEAGVTVEGAKIEPGQRLTISLNRKALKNENE